jgi:hypothetical protein
MWATGRSSLAERGWLPRRHESPAAWEPQPTTAGLSVAAFHADPAVHENVRYVKLAFFSCVAAPFPATPRNLVATRLRALEEPKALGAAGHDVQPGSGSEGLHCTTRRFRLIHRLHKPLWKC